MTLDDRGIGQSATPTPRGYRMDDLDWARGDLAATADAHAPPQRPLLMVGRSFGGRAFGLLPNHDRVASFCTCATGAGWHGWMPRAERLRVLMLWHVAGPLLTRATGDLAWRRPSLGEDLPLDVYRPWRHGCRFPRYVFDDPAMAAVPEAFARVRTPIAAADALDDRLGPAPLARPVHGRVSRRRLDPGRRRSDRRPRTDRAHGLPPTGGKRALGCGARLARAPERVASRDRGPFAARGRARTRHATLPRENRLVTVSWHSRAVSTRRRFGWTRRQRG